MKKIAILASGSGTNAENIYKFFANGNRVKADLVIYDRKNAGVAERMAPYGVETLYIPGSVWCENPQNILELLRNRGIDLVVLAGFLRVIPECLTKAYAGRMINIHPSLLPLHGGMGMFGHKVHEAVIAAGESKSGVTVHYVTNDVDAGEILMQEEVEVTPGDTAETLEQKIHAIEYTLYPRAIMAALQRIEQTPPPIPSALRIESPADEAEGNEKMENEMEIIEEAGVESAVDASTAPAETIEVEVTQAAEKPGISAEEEWAEQLGVKYDPSKIPPHYPGANPAPFNPDAGNPNGMGFGAAPATPGNSSRSNFNQENFNHSGSPNSDLPPMPKNYLTWAVVMTVLCCLPAGIVAVVFASQVSAKYYAGDYAGAEKASERAQIWIIISFVLGILATSLYVPLSLIFT